MKNLIGYDWKDASDGATIEVVNPATNEVIATVPNVTEHDVDEAVKVAVIEQKKWEEVSIYDRAEKLYKFVELVESNKDRLAKLLSDETGKPIKEAYGEIANVKIGVRAFVERAKHLYNESIPAGQEAGQEKTMQITTRNPLGVVAAIIPFNFPSDLFCQKVPPALMMGNSIIVKPSNYNPLTLIEYVKLMIEAGVPAGCIQILTGDGPRAGQYLAGHPGVHLVSLTGSTGAGIQTMGTASKNLTHVMLELGGNDAFIMLEDGYWDLKREKRGSLAAANILTFFFIIAYALRMQFSGYLFTGVLPSQVNVLYEIVKIVIPLGLWVISNWCFTTLMDGEGKMNLSVKDIGGEVLIVSNFTLCANYAHGNRPDYMDAEAPARASELYDYFVSAMRERVCHVGTGVFGADMEITMKADGPVTIVMDSHILKSKGNNICVSK